jgi:uroporphyrinogen-III decarboxylase
MFAGAYHIGFFESLIIVYVLWRFAMSKFDLLRETLLGNLGNRIPFSFWKHHPDRDRTPEGLAEAEIEFHKKFDHDLLKISFFGHYPCIDFGCSAEYDGAITGSTSMTSFPILSSSDWEVLEPVDVSAGEFGNQVKAVELIKKYAHGIVPTMATVFDAPMVADRLCGRELAKYMDKSPAIVKDALDLITDVMIDFARATLEAGADGLFIASQHSTLSSISDAHYKEFIYPNDLKLIAQLRGKAKFIMMHLHAREDNEEIRFDKIAKTSGIDGINWEDQSSALSLAKGKKLARITALGGIDHNGVLRTGTPDDAKDQVLKAVDEAGFNRLIVAPGCVVTVDTPPENLVAVRDAVRKIDPFDNE